MRGIVGWAANDRLWLGTVLTAPDKLRPLFPQNQTLPMEHRIRTQDIDCYRAISGPVGLEGPSRATGLFSEAGIEHDTAVAQLYELIPDADVLLALEPEEIAGAILEALNSSPPEADKFHPPTFAYFVTDIGRSPYPSDHHISIRKVLGEAFMWLGREGLSARHVEPSDYSGGWHFVTRRGRSLSTGEDVRHYRHASMLPKEHLHERIADRCWMSFVRMEYDTAVFQAFKEVEIAVRDAGNYSNSDYGVALMRKAFKPGDGSLTDSSTEPSEQQALSDLFAGAIGSYKNPHNHRTVTITDPTEAIEMILLANHLLRIVEARRPEIV